jgi:N-acetylmuramic acid 6-phosphate (MurNAc-6-P) etherase
MNINKAFNFIAQNNIDPQDVFALVEKIKDMDLKSEESIRKVIRDVSKLAKRPIDKYQENQIVKDIMKNGVNDNLFNML